METYCSENTTELAAAMIEVQRQLAPATRDAVNPFIKNRYATLNSVMETCREALVSNGIWLTQLPVPAPIELGPGHIGLLTKLTHAESGQWQASLTVVPLPKPDPQGMGSAITYSRRYALTAMLGMVTEDDDGEAAKLPPKSGQRTKAVGANAPAARKSPQNQQPSSSDPFQHLPRLDGVTYELVTSNDGRECIVASGQTAPRKEILSGAGFRWNSQRKFWWKYADAV